MIGEPERAAKSCRVRHLLRRNQVAAAHLGAIELELRAMASSARSMREIR